MPELAPVPTAPSPPRPPGLRQALNWAAVAVAGVLWIYWFSGPTALQFIGPIVFLGGYAWVGFQSPDRNTPKLADSVYFMGFLWTLAALIIALIPQRTTVTPAGVFEAFGYALVTTGAGMGLRLFLLQFHYALPDQMQEASSEVDQRVAVFVRTLQAAADDIVESQRAVTDALRKESRALTQALTQARDRAVQAANAAGDAAALRLTTAVQELRSEAQGAAEGMAGVTDAATAASQSIRDAGQSAQSRIDSEAKQTLQALVERLNAAAGAFEVSLRQSAAPVEATLKAAEARAGELDRTIEAAVTSANTARQALGRIQAERTPAVADAVSGALTQVRDLRALAAALVTDLQPLAAAPGELTARFSAIRDGLAAAAARLSAAAGAIEQAEAATARAGEGAGQAKVAAELLQQAIDETLAFLRSRLREGGFA